MNKASEVTEHNKWYLVVMGAPQSHISNRDMSEREGNSETYGITKSQKRKNKELNAVPLLCNHNARMPENT